MTAVADELSRQRERASDPDAPLDELLHLARRFPRRVLANPALQLALVGDPASLQQASPTALQALVRQPDADSLLLAAVTNACSACAPAHESVFDALAARADAPPSVLARLAGWAGNHCTADGREVARYRMRTGVESCSGWDAAIMPAIPWTLRLGKRKESDIDRATEVISGLFAHRLVSVECPLVRALAMVMDTPMRRAALLAGPLTDELWLRSVAHAEHMGSSTGVLAERMRWRLCLAAWYASDPWCLYPPRDNATGFASGMGRQMLAGRIKAVTQGWLTGDLEDIWRAMSGLVAPARGASLPMEPMFPDPPRMVVPTFDETLDRAASPAAPMIVRLLLLTSARCPRPLLLRRARSEAWIVRLAVTCNPELPERERGVLREDCHWIVRGAARGAPSARAAWSAELAKGA
jgi:hypothetical protein